MRTPGDDAVHRKEAKNRLLVALGGTSPLTFQPWTSSLQDLEGVHFCDPSLGDFAMAAETDSELGQGGQSASKLKTRATPGRHPWSQEAEEQAQPIHL